MSRESAAAQSRTAQRTREREARVLELRNAGFPWKAIAQEVGYAGPGPTYKAWQRALARIPRQQAEEARRQQEERLDTMLRSLWPAVLRGDQMAIHRALKVEERRARLLGLDAPTRITGVLTSELDEEIRGLMEAFEADASRGVHIETPE